MQNFTDGVVLVTGGGRGLGREFCKHLAQSGATVVVSGRSRGADERHSSSIESVVREICDQGGKAHYLYADVCDASDLVANCLEQHSAIQAIVHNAGVVRDKSFAKMRIEDWRLVYETHLESAFSLSKAVWEHFCERRYGRLVFVTSAAGFSGNFGQANYAAAKMGVIGLSNTLAIEGERFNIKSNCVSPIAVTDMNKPLIEASVHDMLSPECIAPLVSYLCHPCCEMNGETIQAVGRWFSKIRWQYSDGAVAEEASYSLRVFAEKIAPFIQFSSAENSPSTITDLMETAMAKLATVEKRA